MAIRVSIFILVASLCVISFTSRVQAGMYPLSVDITINGIEAFEGLAWYSPPREEETYERKVLRYVDDVRYELAKRSPYLGQKGDLKIEGSIDVTVDNFPSIHFDSLRMLYRPESRDLNKSSYEDWIMHPDDEVKVIAKLEPIVERIERRDALYDAYRRMSPIGIPIFMSILSLLIVSVLVVLLLRRRRTQLISKTV